MLTIDIPGHGLLELKHLVLDVNGTIAHDGRLLDGVADAVRRLASELDVIVVTADTHGTAAGLQQELGVDLRVIPRGTEAEAKLDLVDELGADGVVAIGNGANDALMLKDAAVGIAVIGGEGACGATVGAADIVVTEIGTALGLLVDPKRLIATLRR
jgi:P-type E1-E2 ATPase